MPFFYSDDPVRDAERHAAWQDKHYVPVCEKCGNPIEGEIIEVICYGIVCEDCYDDHFREDEED